MGPVRLVNDTQRCGLKGVCQVDDALVSLVRRRTRRHHGGLGVLNTFFSVVHQSLHRSLGLLSGRLGFFELGLLETTLLNHVLGFWFVVEGVDGVEEFGEGFGEGRCGRG